MKRKKINELLAFPIIPELLSRTYYVHDIGRNTWYLYQIKNYVLRLSQVYFTLDRESNTDYLYMILPKF